MNSHATTTPTLELVDCLSDTTTVSSRLAALYRAPGPYVSLYLRIGADARSGLDRWERIRAQLTTTAPTAALEAMAAHVAAAGEHLAAVGVIAAANGERLVEHSLAPIPGDRWSVAELPDVATLLEWEQNQIPHIVVEIDAAGATITCEALNPDSRPMPLTLIGTPDQLAADLAARAAAADARLVLVTGDRDRADELACAIANLVHPLCRVVSAPGVLADGPGPSGARYLIDTSRRITGSCLREFRFLATLDATVEGVADTMAALAARTPDVLLVRNADGADEPMVWIGDDPTDLSLLRRREHHSQVPFTAAAIRAAIATDVPVRVLARSVDDALVDDIGAVSLPVVHRLPAAAER